MRERVDRHVFEEPPFRAVHPVAQPSAAFPPDDDVLLDRQVGEELRLLVDDRHSPPAQARGPRLTIDRDVPAVSDLLAGQDLDHRALAGPVGPRDTQDATGGRLEIEIGQGDRVAVAPAEASDDDSCAVLEVGDLRRLRL